MNTLTISQTPQQSASIASPASSGKSISTGLILVYLAIQVADILFMIVASSKGYFRLGASPVAHLFGLSQLGVWIIMKTSAFVVLILAVLFGRRRLILFLNFCFSTLLIWSVVALSSL